MKRILSIILVLTLIWCSSPFANAATIQQNTEFVDDDMDTIDLLVAAYMHMYAEDENQNAWPNEVIVEHKVPLYSTDGEVVAWYIEFASGPYAIINNSKSNPAAIEFGTKPNLIITEIIDNNDEYHIVYEGPTRIFNSAITTANNSTRTLSDTGLYAVYPDLANEDRLLKAVFSFSRSNVDAMITQTVVPMDSYDDYGFITWSDLPQLNCTYGNLPNIDSMNWAVMRDYNSFAHDHCGATCVTNMMLYFARNGYSALNINSNKDITFATVHSIIGNGPVASIANGAQTYCSNRGYTLRYASLGTMNDYVNAINAGRPCSLLLSDEILAWHWVLVVGWIVYGGTNSYVRIVTGWDNSASYFYKFNVGSTAFAGEQYWIAG